MRFKDWMGEPLQESLWDWLKRFRSGGSVPTPRAKADLTPLSREAVRLARMLDLPAGSPEVQRGLMHLVGVMHPQVGRPGVLKFNALAPISDILRRRSKALNGGKIDFSDRSVRWAGTPIKLLRFVHHLWGAVNPRSHLEGARGADASREDNDAFWSAANNAAYPDDTWPPKPRAEEPNEAPKPAEAKPASPDVKPPVAAEPAKGKADGYRPKSRDPLNKLLPDELRKSGRVPANAYGQYFRGGSMPVDGPHGPSDIAKALFPERPPVAADDPTEEDLPAPSRAAPSPTPPVPPTAPPPPPATPVAPPAEPAPPAPEPAPKVSVRDALMDIPQRELEGMNWHHLRDKADEIHARLAADGHAVPRLTDDELDDIYANLGRTMGRRPKRGGPGPGDGGDAPPTFQRRRRQF